MSFNNSFLISSVSYVCLVPLKWCIQRLDTSNLTLSFFFEYKKLMDDI